MGSNLANQLRIRQNLDELRSLYDNQGMGGFSQNIDLALGVGNTLSNGLNPTNNDEGILFWSLMLWAIQTTGISSITNTQTINGAVTAIGQGYEPIVQIWPIVTAGALVLTGAVLNIGDDGILNTIDVTNGDVGAIIVRINCRLGRL